MSKKYHPPDHTKDAFNCPHCDAYARQIWSDCFSQTEEPTLGPDATKFSLVGKSKWYKARVSICSHCDQPTIWLIGLASHPPFRDQLTKMIHPVGRAGPPVNEDLNDEIKEIYNEAADIVNRSPRAACALLRLAVQMLLKQVGVEGDINEGIKKLMEQGKLEPEIQEALDTLRVTGNHAVHPGQIDFDNAKDALALFDWINIIAEALISRRKRIRERFNNLPKKDKEKIKKRDKK